MSYRERRIKQIKQLCDRATFQELESMEVSALHRLNSDLLLYGLYKEYEHVFREAEIIRNRKRVRPSPPSLFSFISNCFSPGESKIKKPTGKIMKDREEDTQQNLQEESFLMRKGSKHEKKTL